MKKLAFAAVLCLCTAIFGGCGSSAESADSSSSAVSEVKNGEFDYDLSTMSSTMVFSTVSNMMISPESYIGKSIKVTGNFNAYHDETTDKTYFAVLIADATACCQQGLEFDLGSSFSYPDDYPPQNALITVTGTFDTYNEGEARYCILKNAALKRE